MAAAYPFWAARHFLLCVSLEVFATPTRRYHGRMSIHPSLPACATPDRTGVCTHAGSGPLRVRRRLFLTMPWGPHPPGHQGLRVLAIGERISRRWRKRSPLFWALCTLFVPPGVTKISILLKVRIILMILLFTMLKQSSHRVQFKIWHLILNSFLQMTIDYTSSTLSQQYLISTSCEFRRHLLTTCLGDPMLPLQPDRLWLWMIVQCEAHILSRI